MGYGKILKRLATKIMLVCNIDMPKLNVMIRHFLAATSSNGILNSKTAHTATNWKNEFMSDAYTWKVLMKMCMLLRFKRLKITLEFELVNGSTYTVDEEIEFNGEQQNESTTPPL